MWQQYRKTFWPMQAFIFILCAIGYFFVKMPLPAALFLYVMLQFGSLFGAWWGMRLRSQLEKPENRLPLER